MGKRAARAAKGKATEIIAGLQDLADQDAAGGRVHELDNVQLYTVDTLGVPAQRPKHRLKPVKPAKSVKVSKHQSIQVQKLVRKKLDGTLPPVAADAKSALRTAAFEQVELKRKGQFDLWAPVPVQTGFIPEALSHIVAKPASIAQKVPVKIPVVQVPVPGQSYNPHPRHHADALALAAQPEFAKLDADERIVARLSYPAELDALQDTEELPAAACLDSESDSEAEAPEGVAVEARRLGRRKTRTDRNRAAREALRVALALKAKDDAKLMKQINRISEIKRDLALAAKLRASAPQKPCKSISRKLSRHAFTPAPMPIALPDELPSCLRRLKPEGSGILDRFKSLEARRVLEPRIAVKRKRRYRLMEVDSHDYKRFE